MASAVFNEMIGHSKAHINLLTNELHEYIGLLCSCDSDVREVWLIGSRANGTARDSSDWDLLVFGGIDSLNRLRCHSNMLAKDNVDVLVVVENDEFEKPWGDKPKSGSLSMWKWCRVSESKATYIQSKRMPRSEDDNDYADSLVMIEKSVANAVLVWKTNTRR